MRLVCILLLAAALLGATKAAAQSRPFSPVSLLASADGKTIFVACATAGRVLCFNTAERRITATIPVPASPTGLALSPEGKELFITCAAPESTVCILDLASQRITGTIPARHTAMAPVLSLDGKTLYVCNRFNNDVSILDVATRREVGRVPVRREPVAAALSRDGRLLLVANHIPDDRADVGQVAAVVSVIDLAARKVVKELALPNGSGSLSDIRVSPDGKYAVLTHLLARFYQPTAHIYRGWMNANALTIVDLAGLEIRSTLLLDKPPDGSANPWGLAWSPDGAQLVVTHAGTHEVTLLDFPKLLARVPTLRAISARTIRSDVTLPSQEQREIANELPFLTGAYQRIKLPPTDLGPRAVALVGRTAYVANYFSDSLSVLDLAGPQPKAESISLDPKPLSVNPLDRMSLARKGEFYFHSATICLEGWQSCSSCHPGDARVDGFNWDLLNDGIGNPKNTKSLLLAFETPPAMWLGVRETAETAVRAGIEHILFTKQPDDVVNALCEYIKSLKPVPSPHLVQGQLSEAAARGKKVFTQAGCITCHPPPLFTDLHSHDVGTRARFDRPTDKFHTPTLVEIWRTAPYLHDGSAPTIRDVLTTRNANNRHGRTSGLSELELSDLCEYVLSL